MAEATSTTRRTLFAGAALIGLAAPIIAEATNTQASLLAELRACRDEMAVLDAGDHSQARWDAWVRRDDAVLAKIEALPIAPENAAIKAEAAMRIIRDQLDDFIGGPTMDCRLLRQVIRCLTVGQDFGSLYTGPV